MPNPSSLQNLISLNSWKACCPGWPNCLPTFFLTFPLVYGSVHGQAINRSRQKQQAWTSTIMVLEHQLEWPWEVYGNRKAHTLKKQQKTQFEFGMDRPSSTESVKQHSLMNSMNISSIKPPFPWSVLHVPTSILHHLVWAVQIYQSHIVLTIPHA